MTSLVDQNCNEIEILQINKNGLRAGDQGLKLVLTSGVEAQSSENIDEDPLKLLVFRVERRHLHLFATSVKSKSCVYYL